MDTGNEIPDTALEEMVAYYRARAAQSLQFGEYEQALYRQGRPDRTVEATELRLSEANEVMAVFNQLAVRGDVLELAPGTGDLTERLAQVADTVTAVDASPEMITANRARVANSRVQYVLADILAWKPHRQYDATCFAFWISHVPLEHLDAFLAMVSSSLKLGGKVFFVDGRRKVSTITGDNRQAETTSQLTTRQLADGREFRIVKNYHDPASLAARFAAVGLRVAVRETATYFLYGVGTRNT